MTYVHLLKLTYTHHRNHGMKGDYMEREPSGEIVRILVQRPDELLLLVKSHGRGNVWELPGGLVEEGELPALAAMRELFEETALEGHKLEFVEALDKPIPHDPNIFWRYYFYTTNTPLSIIIIDNDEIIAYQWSSRADSLTLQLESGSRYFLEQQ